MKILVIDNSRSKRKSLNKSMNNFNDLEVKEIESFDDIPKLLDYALNNNFELVIAAGGDGTMNRVINEAMNLKKPYRDRLMFSTLPCGKANDLARRFNLSKNYNKSLNKILIGKRVKLDIIQVNNKYFITGGGFGLPVQVIKETERLNYLKTDKVYLYAVLKILLKGYNKLNLEIDGKREKDLMLLSIMNQPFIGKRFHLTPNSKINDGYFNICAIKKGHSCFKDILVLQKVIKKSHLNKEWSKFDKLKKVNIKLDKEDYFIGDGELLEYSNNFNFKIIPQALNFIY